MTNATALTNRVLTVIRRSPGVRAVEIAERLGEPTVDVRASLRTLKNAKRVRTSGSTRATSYRVRT